VFPDLVDVVVAEHGVKQSVEVVEEVDHLDGIAERGDGRETYDVAEVDRHLVEVLWLHGGTGFQGLGHRTEDGQNRYNYPMIRDFGKINTISCVYKLTAVASLTAVFLSSVFPPPAPLFSLL